MTMPELDIAQWAADTDRLLIAGLRNAAEDLIEDDDEVLGAVRQRCLARFGKVAGTQYFQTLITTLPDRRPDLFPELADFSG